MLSANSGGSLMEDSGADGFAGTTGGMGLGVGATATTVGFAAGFGVTTARFRSGRRGASVWRWQAWEQPARGLGVTTGRFRRDRFRLGRGNGRLRNNRRGLRCSDDPASERPSRVSAVRRPAWGVGFGISVAVGCAGLAFFGVALGDRRLLVFVRLHRRRRRGGRFRGVHGRVGSGVGLMTSARAVVFADSVRAVFAFGAADQCNQTGCEQWQKL